MSSFSLALKEKLDMRTSLNNNDYVRCVFQLQRAGEHVQSFGGKVSVFKKLITRV